MGRGEHPRYNHHKKFKIKIHKLYKDLINYILEKKKNKKNKAYGQLVLLGFVIANFTPIAYQRHRL